MMKKVFKMIYYLFLAVVAMVVLLLIFSTLPVKGNFRSLVVLSGSMEPKIKRGSIVAVWPAAEYKIGDVITFGRVSRTENPTTHRIYDIKAEGGQKVYVTKGDANNAPDQKTVSESEILGKVVLVLPYVGYAVAKAKTPVGFLLIVIVPSVVIIYEEIRNIAEEVKKHWARRKEKKEKEKEKIPFWEERVANLRFDRPEKNNLAKKVASPGKPLAKGPRKIYN